MTYFCYKCGIKNIESISLPEYVKGLTAFNVNSWEDLKPQ